MFNSSNVGNNNIRIEHVRELPAKCASVKIYADISQNVCVYIPTVIKECYRPTKHIFLYKETPFQHIYAYCRSDLYRIARVKAKLMSSLGGRPFPRPSPYYKIIPVTPRRTETLFITPSKDSWGSPQTKQQHSDT